ncbi:sigma 54-interacting transcriptional regulator [Numidum massiliense]|uniref:sigma 54-interacting transcriptional regulator n=1 Tax=Numidum massiliense TaxID=1522315 RepID=UPI0006D57772|nr:sigma 54-interacting transcriptional regulator [Numidum massiliense]
MSDHPFFRVKPWMNPRVQTVAPDDTVARAMSKLAASERDELPVIAEKGQLIGVLSLSHCVKQMADGLETVRVQRIMSHSFKTLHLSDLFPAHEIETVYITDSDNRLLGVIGRPEQKRRYHMLQALLAEKEKTITLLNVCFDTVYEGLCIVDKKGIIRMFNDAYSRYVGVAKEKAIGRPAEEVIERTRLPVVLETGIPERNQAHQIEGQDIVVHRIPIWRDGNIIGAIGVLMFEGVSEVYNILERMHRFHRDREEKTSVALEPPSPKKSPISFEHILGFSEPITLTKKMARRAAKSTAAILLLGESGVGKELFAKAIHHGSAVREGPFISVNCAAIPETLLESELFGYAEGAFTGSKRRGKPGKFELAHGGTLFLDEIGDMPLAMQAKILRVLQENEVERVGGTQPIPIDFRLIAATNQPLKEMVRQGTFREDLFYRLNVIPIHIPPLRERKEDIPLLLSEILQKKCAAYGMPFKEIHKDALDRLLTYEWPGNVRELVHFLERLVVLVDRQRVFLEDLPPEIAASADSVAASGWRQAEPTRTTANAQLADADVGVEKDNLLRALEKAHGNKSAAAKMLGISRSTLYNKLWRHGIH